MKLSFQLAYRNLIGAGLRTWLNVGILTFTFLVILFYNGLLDGWNLQAKRDAINWEFGCGQFHYKDYDPYNPFSLQEAHGKFDEINTRGTFDAENVKVAAIFNTTISSVDQGQIWMTLEDLWEITAMHNEATNLIADLPRPDNLFEDWNYVSQ